MFNQIDHCPQNPRQTGHCEHTETRSTSAGVAMVSKCCWCGIERITNMSLPKHGQFAPYDAKQHSSSY